VTRIRFLINIILFLFGGIIANLIMNDWNWPRTIIIALGLSIVYAFIYGVKKDG
jgi:hypothetical protein